MLILNNSSFSLILILLLSILNYSAVFPQPLRLYYQFDQKYSQVGSGSLIGKTDYILTAAHLITNRRANQNCSVIEQIAELNKKRAVFLSPKIICTDSQTKKDYIDAVIFIPQKAFYAEILDTTISPLFIDKDKFCLDNTAFYGQTTGKHDNAIFYFNNFSTQTGDSGSVIFNKQTHQAIGVIYGHGDTFIGNEGFPTNYFFPIDGKPGLIQIIRFSPDQIEIRRGFPKSCKAYQE